MRFTRHAHISGRGREAYDVHRNLARSSPARVSRESTMEKG